MDRGGPETAGFGGPLLVSSELFGAPRDARVASWLDGGVRRGTYLRDKRDLSIIFPTKVLHLHGGNH